jgi:hypothetical protein
VYQFNRDEFGEETLEREVIPADKTRIKWTMHLVNRKTPADVPLEQQPDALTYAALEGVLAHPFFPGAEVACARASGDL